MTWEERFYEKFCCKPHGLDKIYLSIHANDIKDFIREEIAEAVREVTLKYKGLSHSIETDDGNFKVTKGRRLDYNKVLKVANDSKFVADFALAMCNAFDRGELWEEEGSCSSKK